MAMCVHCCTETCVLIAIPSSPSLFYPPRPLKVFLFCLFRFYRFCHYSLISITHLLPQHFQRETPFRPCLTATDTPSTPTFSETLNSPSPTLPLLIDRASDTGTNPPHPGPLLARAQVEQHQVHPPAFTSITLVSLSNINVQIPLVPATVDHTPTTSRTTENRLLSSYTIPHLLPLRPISTQTSSRYSRLDNPFRAHCETRPVTDVDTVPLPIQTATTSFLDLCHSPVQRSRIHVETSFPTPTYDTLPNLHAHQTIFDAI